MPTNNSVNLKNSGMTSYDAAGTFNGRTITAPASGITISNGTGISGNPTLALSDDLLAVENLATTGLATRTAASTWTTRTITAGAGVSVSNGDGVSGNPTITAGATVPTTFTTDSGTATPAANNLNILGSGSIATSGSGATVTVALTGLTNHYVLVGAATATITKVAPSATSGIPFISQGASADPLFGTAVVAGGGTGAVTLTNHGVLLGQGTSAIVATAAGSSGQILQSGGASADPAYTTATYPATTTVSQILYSSSTNTVAGLATANRAVLTTGTTGIPVLTALATDGQLIIGSTSGSPAAATLTAGTGVTITNASNAITINAAGGGLTWTVVTGTTQAAAVNSGYIANNAGQVTVTLPATSAVGDIVAVTGINNATGWKIAQNAGNQIFFGVTSTTAGAGGSLTSAATRDVVWLLCTSTNANWQVVSSIGNITVV